MATSSRFLNLRVHHASGLKEIKLHIGPMNPYVTIRIVGHKFHPKSQKTNPHIHGHKDPRWESQMVMELPQDALNEGSLYNLVAEIMHHSHMADRLIGKVTIPLRDVLVNRERVHYLVMTSGDAHGMLVLSHSLIAATVAAGEDDVHGAAGTQASLLSAQAPLPPAPTPGLPAQASLPLAPTPTTNPLVAMAFATTTVDNMVNAATNLVDLFG